MKNNHNHIYICGIGPGHPDYIAPIVYKKVENADILIGGSRHLEIFSDYKKNCFVFTGSLSALKDKMESLQNKTIVVLVSGDTGFYSLRRYIQSALPDAAIDLIPGLSSYQYLYAKVGLGYENALKASLHGKELDFLQAVETYESVFLLTDKKQNWKWIAEQLVNAGYGDYNYHIGIHLSYPDEKIISITAKEALQLDEDYDLSCVIIERNK
ncbi:precorrin-6y C5,15-methyltransferase (decarboxylating) subunit CbiE [Plebeiibacterium sediminum]|uniref:Precorrin-6y C5,15-methyltransferase (Decarboxylating) subunit CbiE n=1 Tax=Plebeiibacterium sediminum TaxID=2992112 RepID=A0AAE3M557_9BACT|nr:precorrin-6y C5,15-methyltransferase (decarboxylating) subunit CbiE [Plebeiobacterium sediminum]MCW3787131.1 precorrin-6y C5,15-methyltransferase (decarboxylating) subunit CbiE [Plebeiobacterium sediminum]